MVCWRLPASQLDARAWIRSPVSWAFDFFSPGSRRAVAMVQRCTRLVSKRRSMIGSLVSRVFLYFL